MRLFTPKCCPSCNQEAVKLITNLDSIKYTLMTALKFQFTSGLLEHSYREHQAKEIIKREKDILKVDLEMDLYRCYACKTFFLRCPSCTSLVNVGMKWPGTSDVLQCKDCQKRMIVLGMMS